MRSDSGMNIAKLMADDEAAAPLKTARAPDRVVPDYTQFRDIYNPQTNYVQSKFAKNLIDASIKKAIEDETFSEKINSMPHMKKAKTLMQRGNTFRK